MTTSDAPQGCDTDRLWALAVGALAEDETQTQELHLVGCADCQARLVAIRADVDALGCYAGRDISPQELAEQILERSRSLQARGKRLRWLALGAVLIAAIAGGIALAHRLTTKTVARLDLERLDHAIQRIQNAEGAYPANDQELIRALSRLRDPEVRLDAQGRPVDHWGRPFRYRYPGVQVPGLFDLWSVGADGVDDAGDSDDQTNWRY